MTCNSDLLAIVSQKVQGFNTLFPMAIMQVFVVKPHSTFSTNTGHDGKNEEFNKSKSYEW